MLEVHLGTRAGRPIVLILLTAGALVCALALAWVQVQARLALGDPVHVEDTPLIVRPPVGWVEDPPDSGVFVKPVRKMAWGREVWAAERKIEFRYNDYFTQLSRLFQAASLSPGVPAEIAGWPGAQWILTRRGQRWEEQTLFRWVSAPWGGQLSVEYTPLGDASDGDARLLDTVCKAIQLDGANLIYGEKETLDHAGMSLEPDPGWKILGPQNLGGPGFCVQDAEEDPPRWALAIFRRSLRSGMPTELLVNEAMHTPGAFSPVVERLRDDRAFVAATRCKDNVPGGSAVVSLRVLVESRPRAAIIYALAPPQHASLADEAAERLVESVEFVSDFPQ